MNRTPPLNSTVRQNSSAQQDLLEFGDGDHQSNTIMDGSIDNNEPDMPSPNNNPGTVATGLRVQSIAMVKLPTPFWRANPTRYFTMAEMKFELYRIRSDESKYRIIATHLDGDTLDIVGDIIDNPPVNGKYEALKHRLINALSESQETRLRRLLTAQHGGEEKPTVLLQRLRNLSGGQCNDTVLRSIFVEQLPSNARAILAGSRIESLSELAEHADKIFEAIRPSIAVVNAAEHSSSSTNNDVDDLRATIAALTTTVRKLARQQQQPRDQCRSRSKQRYSSDNNRQQTESATKPTSATSKLCYYHQRFGAAANRCRQPCEWVSEN